MKAIFAALILSLPTHANFLWLEAESPSTKNTHSNSWYYSVKKDLLSGNNLLAHWGNQPATATYKITIPKTAGYTLWLRANPVATKLSYRLNQDPWTNLDFKKNSHETLNIAADNNPDLRFLSWVSGGRNTLPAGQHTLTIRFSSDNNNHGMLDCLCLNTDPLWKPSKTLKPGQNAPHYPVPKITTQNIDKWLTFIRPASDELGWRKIRWHSSLSQAATEAKKLNRPILLWAMNGHPCGET